ncbi:MAG: ABC transporter substrate-binding protein [Clostridiales bacterium]|nr:ABC transporter substrate-binding protein [Clostridiales bacterium]
MRGVFMKKSLTLLTAVLVGASLFTGCKKEDSGDTIKVGLNYELSGQVATYGRSLVEGIELAFEEINNNGGVLDKKIEAVKMDNKSDTAESANITTKLATKEKVVLILGAATSGNTKAAAPMANKYKVPLVSASATADDVTVDKDGKVRDYIFKTCFSDSFQGVIMAKFAGEELAAKKAAMLVDTTSDYSKGLADSFKKNYTGQIVAEEAYKSKDTDFKAVLTNIKATNPDVLFVPGYYEEVGLIIKQARELGIEAPVLGGDGYDSPKLLELAGKDALNKVYYTNHYSSQDTSEEVTKFKEAFKAKYNKEPDAFNALGYDLGYLAVDAIKRAGKADAEAIKEALAATKDFKAVTGTLTMDEQHNPVKAITILEVKNGEITFLEKLEP